MPLDAVSPPLQMLLYYCRLDPPNFGDELNTVLWPRVGLGPFAGIIDYDTNRRARELPPPPGLPMFIGIGTLLNNHIPRERRAIVFGSGVGYGEPPELSPNWTIAFVRGPMTARRLGLPGAKAITDPAILVRDLEWPTGERRSRFGFCPHHSSTGSDAWPRICADLGVRYIDPRGTPDDVLGQIKSCDMVICGAMHGAIVADALRVPWIPVTYGGINEFKWTDWCASLELEYKPRRVPAFWPGNGPLYRIRFGVKMLAAKVQMARLMREQPCFASKDSVARARHAAVLDKLDALRRDPALVLA